MSDHTKPRAVTVRRTLTLGTVLAGVAAAGPSVAGDATASDDTAPAEIILASAEGEGEGGEGEGEGGEGEGEGEGSAGLADPEQRLHRDLSFMEGHLRAGLALYEAGDLKAAKTHMGHPIEEKYDAVAAPLEEMGKGALRDRIEAIAKAAEAEAPLSEVRAAYDAAHAIMNEVRGGMTPADQVMGLAALTRVAGAEYTVAVKGGEVSNLHEYQDSWGFLRVVEAEARKMAESDDAAVAAAGQEILGHLDATDAAFGDIQGEGSFDMNPSILMGAAARIELTGFGLN